MEERERGRRGGEERREGKATKKSGIWFYLRLHHFPQSWRNTANNVDGHSL